MHEQHQYCHVSLWTPITKAGSAKAAPVVGSLQEQLLNLKIQVIDRDNITQT